MLLGIFLGILLMQTIMLIVAILTNENEVIIIYTSVIIFMPFILLLRFIIKKINKIKKYIKRKKENKNG
jgi:archaellum biogenesis protein FlaJ (TadC family)